MRVSSIFRPLSRDRPWRGAAAGAGLFLLALGVRWALGDLVQGFGPMLLLPAILLAGLVGGIRVGLGVAAGCILVAWTWFFPPYGTFVLRSQEAVTLVTFILTAALELYVIRSLNLAINDLSVEKERSATMFRELQHRVANNLQGVGGVLRQARKALGQDSDGAQALIQAQERLDLMVRVHLSLNNPSLVDLPVGAYLRGLGEDLIKASNTPDVRLTVIAAPVTLDVERLMSLSMIVVEAMTNALKYAFAGRSDGNITIRLGLDGHDYELMVSDDGPGFQTARAPSHRASLGRGIMESLVSQLGGKLSMETGSGATVRVAFPVRSGGPHGNL